MLFAEECNRQRAAAMPVMMDMLERAVDAMRSLEVHNFTSISYPGAAFIAKMVSNCQTRGSSLKKRFQFGLKINP